MSFNETLTDEQLQEASVCAYSGPCDDCKMYKIHDTENGCLGRVTACAIAEREERKRLEVCIQELHKNQEEDAIAERAERRRLKEKITLAETALKQVLYELLQQGGSHR
jgi:hypothetical protein